METNKFPEKWCINRQGRPEVGQWFNFHNSSDNTDYDTEKLLGWFTHCPSYENSNHTSDIVEEGYTEITFEQFMEHILDQKSEKEILGAFCIKDFPGNKFKVHSLNYSGYDFTKNTQSWNDFKPLENPEFFKIQYKEDKFKVGDWVYAENDPKNLNRNDWRINPKHIPTFQIKEIYEGWLRPEIGNGTGVSSSICRKATKEEIELVQIPKIVIKGYPAKFKENNTFVSFGCQEYSKEFVKAIYEFLEKSGLKIEHQEEIKQVYNYFNR